MILQMILETTQAFPPGAEVWRAPQDGRQKVAHRVIDEANKTATTALSPGRLQQSQVQACPDRAGIDGDQRKEAQDLSIRKNRKIPEQPLRNATIDDRRRNPPLREG